MTCPCGQPATALYKHQPRCLSCYRAAILEEATAILERQALDQHSHLWMKQNDPAGSWYFDTPPTYTLEPGP